MSSGAPTVSPVRNAATCGASAPRKTMLMPSWPQPCCRDTSRTSQVVSDPTVEVLTVRPFKSATLCTGPSLATIMASSSGGPAIAATPRTGAPLATNASSGPELAFVAKGAPVLGVAAMAGPPLLLAMIVAKDGPVHSVADLKGRTVSTSTVGSLTTWLVREVSRQQGWGHDGINIVFLGADAPQVAALRTGQTVGAPLDIATGYRLEEEGVGRILLRFGDYVHDFHTHVIYARKSFIAANPEGVRSFLAGWFETIAFMRQNKDETVRVAAPIMNVSPAIAGRAYDELMPMFSDTGRFNAKALATLQRSFVDMGTLPEAPDMSTLYT